MRGSRFLGVATLVAIALSTTGCARLAGQFKPAPKVVVLAPKMASVEATLVGSALATGRPESLPLWPGSKIAASAKTATPQGASWTSRFTTADDYETVIKGFVVGLKKAGWSADLSDMSVDAAKTALLSAGNSSADALFTITRSAESSVTTIDVVVTPK